MRVIQKHVIIHVGPHKTGTTYLQTALVQFRNQLKERGIFYPPWWGPVAHYDLLDRLLSPSNPELVAQFDELRRMDSHTIVISVEGLVDIAKENIQFLASLIEDASVTVVFYARSWAAVLASTWREVVKEGSSMTLPEFMFPRIANPIDSSTINYAKGLDVFSDVFGKEAIKIVSYDTLISGHRDIWQHFADEFLDWIDAPMPRAQSVNVSLGTTDTETIRAMNAIESERRVGPVPSQFALATTASYLRLKNTLRLDDVWRRQEMYTTDLVIDETTPNLRTVHRGVYAAYADCLIGPKPAHLFFEPRSVKIPHIKLDYLIDAHTGRTLLEASGQIVEDAVRRKASEEVV